MPNSTQVTFEDWVRYLFDHDVTETAWYWGDGEGTEGVDLPPDVFIDYGTKLLRNSESLLKGYSDGQVHHGLYLLISNNVSDEIFALKNQAVPIQKRLAFLEAIFHLNRDCFAERCTPHLSHSDLNETPEHVSPLNENCYMWWDIFIVYGSRDDPGEEPLNRTALNVMERCLTIAHPAVQEGALHGLGHFHAYYPAECEKIVATFIADHREAMNVALRNYAERAKVGSIL